MSPDSTEGDSWKRSVPILLIRMLSVYVTDGPFPSRICRDMRIKELDLTDGDTDLSYSNPNVHIIQPYHVSPSHVPQDSS